MRAAGREAPRADQGRRRPCDREPGRLLEPTLEQFSFTFALAPSGAIAITPHDGAATFVDCAARALAGANLLAYDGAPQQFEQTLVFSGSHGAGG